MYTLYKESFHSDSPENETALCSMILIDIKNLYGYTTAMSSKQSSCSSTTSFVQTTTLPSQEPTPCQLPTKGYPWRILGLTLAEIDPDYICGQCTELLRDPVQASCGHRFCRYCLNELFKG